MNRRTFLTSAAAIEVKHWGARHKTFQLSDEPFHEPIERAEAALAAEADRLVVRDVGETAIILSDQRAV